MRPHTHTHTHTHFADPGWSTQTIVVSALGAGFAVCFVAAIVLAVLLRRAKSQHRTEGSGLEPLASTLISDRRD